MTKIHDTPPVSPQTDIDCSVTNVNNTCIITCMGGASVTETKTEEPMIVYEVVNTSRQHLPLHCDDGPAVVKLSPHGCLRTAIWYRNGKIHRTDGPAVIEYSPSGAIVSEQWFFKNTLHRVDGPAHITYDSRGDVVDDIWMQDEYLFCSVEQKERLMSWVRAKLKTLFRL